MKLYIIRHAQTAWNAKGILQGSNDIDIVLPLDAQAEEKVSENVAVLQTVNFDLVLTSQYKRTAQTAAVYGYDEVTVEPLLNELNFGEFEGQPKQVMIDALGDQWLTNPRQLSLGESLVSFEERVKAFIEKYKSVSTILAFGHGSWMRGLLSIDERGTVDAMNKVSIDNHQLLVFEIN